MRFQRRLGGDAVGKRSYTIQRLPQAIAEDERNRLGLIQQFQQRRL